MKNKNIEKLVKMNALISMGFKRENGSGFNNDIHLSIGHHAYCDEPTTIDVVLH